MSYAVKEIYYTIQGEGVHTGRPAVFLRFAGCNLWSGRPEDRHTAVCNFCDTDFRGGQRLDANAILQSVCEAWPSGTGAERAMVVVTGGEPLLQLDDRLRIGFMSRGLAVHVETNGTVALDFGVDWLTVSPKAGTDLAITSGDELKLVYPQPGLMPHSVEHLDFDHFILQPMTPTTRMFA